MFSLMIWDCSTLCAKCVPSAHVCGVCSCLWMFFVHTYVSMYVHVSVPCEDSVGAYYMGVYYTYISIHNTTLNSM